MRGKSGKERNSGSFNNLSVLKRAIYYYGPQTTDDLVNHMREALPYHRDPIMLRDIYVLPALTKQKYFVQLPDGRWDIVWDQAQAEENRMASKILSSEQAPLSLPEIRKRVAQLLAKDISEVHIDLDNDPRFTAIGANHYALSEWHLLNDEAYELLAREPGRYLTEQEIIRQLVSLNQFMKESVVFAPKADPRFRKGPRGTWGLALWLPPVQKKGKRTDSSLGLPTPVEVTPEQRDLVRSRGAAIEVFVRSSPEAVRPRQIVEIILGVQVGSVEYAPLLRAVERYLGEHGEYLKVGPDQWRLKEQVPSEVWKSVQAVSTPRIRGSVVDELEEEAEEPRSGSHGKSRDQNDRTRAKSWRVILTFAHWRAGSLRVPASKALIFTTASQDVAEFQLLIAGSLSNRYPVWLNAKTRTFYGFRVIYDLLGMLPGSVFYLTPSTHRMDQLILDFSGEVDGRIQREQSRLMDVDALNRRANQVGRSFREILIDVLRDNPEGLSFWEVFDRVSEVRPVAIATLRNLLSTLPCFYQSSQTAGRWLFDPSKPTVRRRRKLKLRYPHQLAQLPRSNAEDPARPLDPALNRVETELRTPEGSIQDVEEVDLEHSPVTEEIDPDPADTVVTSGVSMGDEEVGTKEGSPCRDTLPLLDAGSVSDSQCTDPGGSRDHLTKESTVGLHPTSVKERVAALLEKGVADDKLLIWEYLSKYHGVSIDREFLSSDVPPPETIRRSRQTLASSGDLTFGSVEDHTTVRGRVRTLLQDESLHNNDRKLIVMYYRKYHGISISDTYLDSGVPSMETIRRARQELTSSGKQPTLETGEEEDHFSHWFGEALVKATDQTPVNPGKTNSKGEGLPAYHGGGSTVTQPGRNRHSQILRRFWKQVVFWIHSLIIRHLSRR